MTVSTTTRRQQFTLDGVTDAFTFTFRALVTAPTDVKAVVTDGDGVDTDLTYTTDYSITINSNGVGGTLTLVDAAAVGTGTLTIYRQTTNTQESDYDDFNQFPADSVERDFDRRTMVAQEVDDDISRTMRLRISTDPAVDAELPVPVADKFLGWNAAGTAIENKTVANTELEKANQEDSEGLVNDVQYMTPLQTKYGIDAFFSNSNMIFVPDGGDIQTAIDALSGTNGTVVLAYGTYTITAALNVNHPCNIVGQGPTRTFVVLNADSIYGFNITSNFVTLRDFNIDMRGDGDVGIIVDGTKNATQTSPWTNVYIHNLECYYNSTTQATLGLGNVLIKDASVEMRDCILELNATSASTNAFYNVKIISASAGTTFFVNLWQCQLDTVNVNTTGAVYGIQNIESGTPTSGCNCTAFNSWIYSYNLETTGESYGVFLAGTNSTLQLQGTNCTGVGAAGITNKFDVASSSFGTLILSGAELGFGTTSGSTISFSAAYQYATDLVTATINDNYSTDLEITKTLDIATGSDGRAVKIYRTEGSTQSNLQLFVDQYSISNFQSADALNIVGGISGDYATKEISIFGNVLNLGYTVTSSNMAVRFNGYISAAGDYSYVQAYVNDTTDNFEFTRLDGNIGAMDIQLPLITDDITSTGNVTLGTLAVAGTDSIYLTTDTAFKGLILKGTTYTYAQMYSGAAGDQGFLQLLYNGSAHIQLAANGGGYINTGSGFAFGNTNGTETLGVYGTFLANSTVNMPNLPTSDPAVAGQIYSTGGVLMISAG